jgi:diacylglycerol O-acyltransferase
MALVFNQMCDNPVQINLPGTGGKAILKSTTREKVTWRWSNLIFFWRFITVIWFYFLFGVGCILLAYKWTREILRGKDPKTHFKGKLSVKKRVAFSIGKIKLDDVKRAAAPYHATVNDILLSCVAGALDRYTYHRAESANQTKKFDRIRVGIPVNVRRPTDLDLKPSNKFGFVIASVPINMRADPVKQLLLTKKDMNFNKRLPEQYVSFKMSQYTDMLPSTLIPVVFEYLADYLTCVLTNVRGSETPSYICGRAVKEIIGFVPPPSGVGLGVAIFSYNGKVTVSFVTDDNLIKDPEKLVQDFEDTFEQLLQMAVADSPREFVLKQDR